MLDREEHVEQAYFFRTLGERLPENMPLQELLGQIGDEVLATTKLPLAISFLLTELSHTGVMSTAMARLNHYFTPFQTYLIGEAENERGRFDTRIAIDILRYLAEYQAATPTPQGLFMYQFESLCRNRLSYDLGLEAMSQDPHFDSTWQEWIHSVRRNVGVIEFADLLYVASEHYATMQKRRDGEAAALGLRLFGEKEGKIALANRKKNPLFLFSALQRQLGYPVVPRPRPKSTNLEVIPQMLRRIERMEVRIKLLEDEQREGGFDLTKFYRPPDDPAVNLDTDRPEGG